MAKSRGVLIAERMGISKKADVVVENVKSERDLIMEELEAKGIEFKKNESTAKLKEKLGE